MTCKTDVDVRHPSNASELRRALTIGRPNVSREVYVDSRCHNTRNRDLASGRFDVSVHPDSRLAVYVGSGIPFLKLRRGHLTVTFTSTWGNSLELYPGTSAKVVVPYSETKVTVTGDDTGLDLVLPEGDKHRVYWPSKYLDITRIAPW